ncbi:MAG: MFS transporter [Bacilli bacterium]|nr:MFS transporter [Bacilli bacterium]
MKQRLSKKQMIIFSVGQFGWSLLGGIISAWLVTFFLPTSGDVEAGAVQYIIPGLAIGGFLTVLGLITALSRIFDAVTDPLIASLSDRSTNKRGRRIPFMQVASIPFAVVTVLLFCIDFGKYDSNLGWLNILWVSVMIVLFYLFMTMYCTPYNALISEFGQIQEDRMFISTAISFTYLFGTLFAYLPFVVAPMLRGALGFAWSYRACFIALAAIALVGLLLPTFLLKETDFIDPKPSNENVFKSLTATFKNKDFRVFSGSDIMYWVGLTMFQTGLPYFVRVSMGFDSGMVMVFMGGMTLLAAVFYPFVTKFVKKWGKKKLVIAGFFGLAICYAIAAVASIPGVCPAEGAGASGLSWVFGIAIMVVSALPMALLGIIPQSIVADVAEAEAKTTGQNREGMFFAARTFAMKFGQSLAMILFTSLAVAMAASTDPNEIYPGKEGMIIVAVVAVAFCVLGAIILFFYREKKVMKTIAKAEDAEFLKVIEEEKDPGEAEASK